jgi:hypothetical protein
MKSQDPHGIQIDRIHTGAICNEIGERLRATLTANADRWPLHILNLTERLDRVEGGRADLTASSGKEAR